MPKSDFSMMEDLSFCLGKSVMTDLTTRNYKQEYMF